jgi:hypothetical protein
MSKMCKIGSKCSTHKGMCGHEITMLGMMIMIVGLVFWLA